MKICKSRMWIVALLAGVVFMLTGASTGLAEGYYSGPTIFQPYPAEKDKKPWNVKNFGPVGIGIDIKQPGFVMVISNVEKGSPADQTGKIKKGQIIESINGKVLKDRDPRQILGDIITEAEARDGKINLRIQDVGSVVVNIPIMGSYAELWTMPSAKADKIVRQLADQLGKEDKPRWGSVLFLLSTGEEKDLDVVKKWMNGIETIGGLNWDKGYRGIGICEYYLRTGDQSVLPVIKRMTEELKANMYAGGWSGRGTAAQFTYSVGSGQMHAAGVHCLTFLLMAQLCGVDVDKTMLNEALTSFYRFAGHGNVPYGAGLPEGGFRDNGKTGGLAVAMAAAALLTPDGEHSVYAQARDNCAMKSFYATNWFHVAHTGGGIGEIWHHMAMGLIREKMPIPYRSYMDTRRWMIELSRRFDGGIGIAGVTDRYDKAFNEDGHAWGTYIALTYTLPRKTLQLYGAPRSPYAKTYQLPQRPWGDKADDAFVSTEPIPGSSLTMDDVKKETVELDASLPAMTRMGQPDVSDAVLERYFHHPEYGLRVAAIRVAVRNGRYQLVPPLLKSADPRLRDVGLQAITGMFKGDAMPAEQITPQMYELVGKMIEDPNESWWVLQDAVDALGRADAKVIAHHVDRLLQLLDHPSRWVRNAAGNTLANIATLPQYYQTVLPKVVDKFPTITVIQSLRPANVLEKKLQTASPQVKEYAVKILAQAYDQVPDEMRSSQGMVVPAGADTIRNRIGGLMLELPGGADMTLKMPKKTSAYVKSGKQSDMYVYAGFKLDKTFTGKWLHLGVMSATDDLSKKVEAAHKAIEAQKKRAPTGRNRYKPSYLVLKPDGKVDQNTFWSGDMLIDIPSSQARKMMVRTADGKQYLLVEDGNFPATPEQDWSPRYSFYERTP